MIGVLTKKKKFRHRERHKQREDNVKMQGGCHLLAREHLRVPEARREAWK